MGRTRRTGMKSTVRIAPPRPHDSNLESDSGRGRSEGESSGGVSPSTKPQNDSESEPESVQDSNDQSPRPVNESEFHQQRIRKEARDEAMKEIEKIRKEVRDEAIKETEAKYKRKVQETFQCVVCLRIPKEGHIIQCQNGHGIPDCYSSVQSQRQSKGWKGRSSCPGQMF